jgi:hypothetical protein
MAPNKASRLSRSPTHDPPSPCGASRNAVALLLLLTLLLLWFQYTTLDKLSDLPPGQSYASPAVFWGTITRTLPLNVWDAFNVLLLVACGLSVILLEIRRQGLTHLLNAVFSSERRTLVGLALTSLVLVRYYFARGDLSWVADTSAHTAYAWITAQSFAQGEIPIWTNYLGAGSPFLQFYGFTFYYAAALVHLLVRDLFWSIKIVLATCHVLSGVTMYLFLRVLCRSRHAGFLGGLAYVLSFWHTQQMLPMGRLPLSVFYACLPLPFYCFERLRISRNWPGSAVWGAFYLGILAFTHPGYAFWATVFLGVYATVRISSSRRRGISRTWLRRTALLLVAGVLFGSCLTVPMWLERSHTGLHAGFAMSDFPDPTWQHLLVWSNYRVRLWPLPVEHDHWYGGYVGLSLVGISLAGGVAAARKRRRPGTSRGVAAAACLALALVLVFGYRWPVLRDLQVVQALNAGRYLLFVVAFLSATAGAAVAVLSPRPGRLYTIVLLLLLVDLGTTTFQHPYLPGGQSDSVVPMPSNKLDELREERDRQPAGQLPDHRVYYATGDEYRPRAIAWLPVMAGARSFLTNHNEAPLAVRAFGEPLERVTNPVLESEGRGIDNPEDYLAGLHLLNVKKAYALTADTSQPTGWSVLSWSFPGFEPVVVSPRAIGWSYPASEFGTPASGERVLDLIRTMGVNSVTGTCKQILLADSTFAQDLGGAPFVEVLSHRAWNQRVELRVRITGPCFARLAYAYYPYLRVTVDGEGVRAMPTAGRFIALRLEAGEHTILLEPYLSPLRRALLGVDLVLLAVGALVLVRQRRSRGTGG